MAQAATAKLAPKEESRSAPEGERVASVVFMYSGVPVREDGGGEEGNVSCGYFDGKSSLLQDEPAGPSRIEIAEGDDAC